jgi:heme/copper-type cytochrome/quinol oxidase subunit 1
MTRRIYTYDHGLGWDAYNLVETIGGYILAAGLLLIAVNIVVSYRRGVPAGRDPFHGGTLEWTTTSPPPHYNFAVIPTVSSPYPNWDEADREEDLRKLARGDLVLADGHETPETTVNDAEVSTVADMPPESPWPVLAAATATAAFFLLLTSHYATAGMAFTLTLLTLVGWNVHEPEEEAVA